MVLLCCGLWRCGVVDVCSWGGADLCICIFVGSCIRIVVEWLSCVCVDVLSRGVV